MILGSPARDKNFFQRDEVEWIWERINASQNVLLAAPRREGKTSIMFNLQESPKPQHIACYVDTEAIYDENNYYKKLFETVIDLNFTKGIQIKEKVIGIVKEIETDYFKIKPNDEYLYKFTKLLEKIDLKDNKLILMIDEFPQTLKNIWDEEGKIKAIHFLQTNRELRINLKISNKINFIYAGSIGIGNILEELNAVEHMNDVVKVKLKCLSNGVAIRFIKEYLNPSLNFKLDDNQIKYILDELEYLTPYYIQLVIDKLKMIYIEKKIIDLRVIDEAFKDLVEDRHQFYYWHSRLEKIFKTNEEYNFALKLLETLKYRNITIEEINSISQEFDIKKNYKFILGTLKENGYINVDESNNYRFLCPILKKWWVENA